MKRPRRGRPPIGRKAMTAAERQARRRNRLREAEAAVVRQQTERRAYQPPRGYGRAKDELIKHGHHFEHARREFGFEEGVFVDGAFLSTGEVIALAKLEPRERKQRLDEARRERKSDACGAVEGCMAALRVSLDELIQYLKRPTCTATPPTAPAAG